MSESVIAKIAEEERAAQAKVECTLYCCAGTACLASGGVEWIEAIHAAARAHDVQAQLRLVSTGCLGLCSEGPLLKVEVKGHDPVMYKQVTPMMARLIFAEHVLGALHRAEGTTFEVPPFFAEHILPNDHPFYARQQMVVLANSGRVDPERIEDYIAHDGYAAFEQALSRMKPEEVVQEILDSGLRGRGGGGYPTGLKWKFLSQAPSDEKYIICNGDEGDPGAYMDRSILESDPHAVLEGMMIAAYATGATEGWFYIRAEYPLAYERVETAIKAARKNKLLGKNVLGTDFRFNCEVRLGAGAFVCGEETALIRSIEGQRGTPVPRPPYPTESGLFGKPSVVNNVETLANIAPIIRRGAGWFSGIGTETSKGTKVFALSGKINNSGPVEVPMGMPLKEIVEQIGGGASTGKPIKAVQTGGPSGGVIPRDKLNTAVCYEELKKLGSIMGSGGMIVMDTDDSMVDIAAFYLGFTVDESCGKCAPCRVGGTQMLGLLTKIRDGKGTPEDLELVKSLARAMQKASLCGLGATAANPVISTMKYFGEEYTRRIKQTVEV